MSNRSIDKLNDIKKLFQKSVYEVTNSKDETWTITFGEGRYKGYTLTLNGEALGSTGLISSTGTINCITIDFGNGTPVELSGLHLPTSTFLKKTKLDKIEDEVEDEDEVEGDEVEGDEVEGETGDDNGDDGEEVEDETGDDNGGGDEEVETPVLEGETFVGTRRKDVFDGGDGNDDISGNKGNDRPRVVAATT